MDPEDIMNAEAGQEHPPRTLTLTATGRAREEWPRFLGDYTITGEEHGGRPVYRNSKGGHLYTLESGAWWVTSGVGYSEPRMRSINPAPCPALCQEWEYYVAGGKYEPGDITVTFKC